MGRQQTNLLLSAFGIAVGPVVVGVLTEQFSIVTAMQLPVALAGGLVVVLGLTCVAERRAGN